MRTRTIIGIGGGLALVLAGAIYFQPHIGVPSAYGSDAGAFRAPGSTLSAPGAVVEKAITVVGEAQVAVPPDEAYVTAGVQTRAQTAKEAQALNAAAMEAVLAQIKAAGIADKDIQTSGISLYPVTQRDNEVTGYQATNVVTLRVNDVADVGAVLDAATNSGANFGVSVRFGLRDSSAAKNRALEAATKAAQGKAEAIARGIGATLGPVEAVAEEDSSISMKDGGAFRMAAADMASTPIESGELIVTARTRVTYSY